MKFKILMRKARDFYIKHGFVKTLKKTISYSSMIIKNKYYGYLISTKKNDDDYWAPLIGILNANKKNIEFIDIFHVPMGWNTKLFQRFQHISLNVGSIGGLSFYGAHPAVDEEVKVLKRINDRLYLINFENYDVKKKFFEILDGIDITKVIRIQSIDLATTIEEVETFINKGYQIIYEYIDEITPDITGDIPEFVVKRHHYLLSNEEKVGVVATSEKLYEQVIPYRRKNFILSCNGVDYEHWNNVNKDIPKDMKIIIDSKKPIIGYHGALAKWIDYDLIEKISDTNKYEIVLIGHEHDLSLTESGLKKKKNVHVLGSKNYLDLNAYSKYYDIAIIPFKINNITQSVSPVKLFEYMAADKPIVTYGLRECLKYKSCIIASDANDFIKKIEEALELRNSKEYIDILRREAKENTWLSKTVQMKQLILQMKDNISIINSENNELMKKYIDNILSIPLKSQDYIAITPAPHIRKEREPKIIAYYLPQYYPFKENDEWWGKGTTEWNNVCKSVPQYVNHYQPRIPGELGYYDLRVKENIERQVELAKMYGIFGFAYYYYWFDGKRLLDKPLDMLIENKDIDMPFCLCWANENWTRRFDGTNTDIIMEQPSNLESYKSAINEIITYMKDSRYIEISGKKVLIIYRPSFIPDFKEVLGHWRDIAKKNGIGDLYIIAVKENTADLDLIGLGFDAISEFHPGTIYRYCKDITDKINFIRDDFSGQILDYKDIVENKKYFKYQSPKLYRSIMPMWDNTARRNNKGMIFENSSPELYSIWLEDILEESLNKDLDEPIVFINAWNEWGEGAYMEPDKKYGYAYLEKTKNALENIK